MISTCLLFKDKIFTLKTIAKSEKGWDVDC